MTQATEFGMQSGPPAPPTAVAIRINDTFNALLTLNSGATAPTYAQACTQWMDTSGTPWEWKVYDGTQWLLIGEIDPATHSLTLAAGVSIDIGDVNGLQDALDDKVPTARSIGTSGLASGGGNLSANRTITVTIASQGQAEAGSANNVAMTPLRTAQAIVKLATVGLHTIGVPGTSIVPRATDGPSTISNERTVNRVMEVGLEFDPNNHRYAQFFLPMPKSWDAGPIFLQFLWTAHSSSGNVIWGGQAISRGDGDGIDTGWGTVQEVTDTLQSTGALHITGWTTAVTPSGSPAQNDMLWIQVYRAGASGGDTLGANATLLGVRVAYTTNASTDD